MASAREKYEMACSGDKSNSPRRPEDHGLAG
jgi:hypothetical protein